MTDADREQLVRDAMEQLGMDEDTAREAVARSLGEIPDNIDT